MGKTFKIITSATIIIILFTLLFCIPIPISMQGEMDLDGYISFDKLIEEGKNFEDKWISYTKDGREIPDDFEWNNITINGIKLKGSAKVYVPYYMIIAGFQS